MKLTDNWDRLTPDEKFEKRFELYKTAGDIDFVNQEIEEKYKMRVQLIKDVVELKKPQRIPIVPNIGFFPAEYAGITCKEAMYDYEKLGEAWKKFNRDFDFDYIVSSGSPGSGPLLEKLGFKMYRWPGHGLNKEAPFQCIEREYMKGDEYDEFINDPSSFFIRTYFPRIFEELKSWTELPFFTSFIELPFVGSNMISIGMPEVQKAFNKFLEAGEEAQKWGKKIGAINREIQATMGLPSISGGYTKAPFDILGDTMRDTKNIMLDMFRRPEKIFAALEKLLPLAIKMGVNAATTNKNPFVRIPLHKGADSFLSRSDFEKFYWPSLKELLIALIEEGCVPSLFVEGSYNERLDIIAKSKIPTGRSYWHFDKTDMVKAKKHFSNKYAISGNVPGSLIKTGTPEEVKKYVRKLINKVGVDGGYALTTGTVIDVAKTENIKAMIDAGREYGEY